MAEFKINKNNRYCSTIRSLVQSVVKFWL